MKEWLLVFMFAGTPMASGPYERMHCVHMTHTRPGSHCWNPATNERLRPPVEKTQKGKK
jgi:hypothetical protein